MIFDRKMKYRWDNENVLEYEKKQAINNKMLETAKKLKDAGVAFQIIVESTGLSIDEIVKL